MPASQRKGKATKRTEGIVWSQDSWNVVYGELKRGRGRPRKAEALFRVVAEKLPFESLDDVRKGLADKGIKPNGVYVAHDSMGVARYVGRGNIFNRLKTRYNAQVQELKYFSFYVVLDKAHEREIETLLIRSAGPQLHFNSRKKRVDIQPGNIRDFEPGTLFYERQYKRGRRKRSRRGRRRTSG
jgi:hypothetical protein